MESQEAATPRKVARAIEAGRTAMAYEPVTAWKALEQVYQDPDDTRAVFVLLDALSALPRYEELRSAGAPAAASPTAG